MASNSRIEKGMPGFCREPLLKGKAQYG
jgi:hypothetical protein